MTHLEVDMLSYRSRGEDPRSVYLKTKLNAPSLPRVMNRWVELDDYIENEMKVENRFGSNQISDSAPPPS